MIRKRKREKKRRGARDVLGLVKLDLFSSSSPSADAASAPARTSHQSTSCLCTSTERPPIHKSLDGWIELSKEMASYITKITHMYTSAS